MVKLAQFFALLNSKKSNFLAGGRPLNMAENLAQRMTWKVRFKL